MKKKFEIVLIIIIISILCSCRHTVNTHIHEWMNFECVECGLNYYSTAKLGDLILKDGSICKPKDFSPKKAGQSYRETVIIFREANGEKPALGMLLEYVLIKGQWCTEEAIGAKKNISDLIGDYTTGLIDGSQAWRLLGESCSDAWENPKSYYISPTEYYVKVGSYSSYDWYVPTINELYSLYLNKDKITKRLLSEMNYSNFFNSQEIHIFSTCNQDPDNAENYLALDFSDEGKIHSFSKKVYMGEYPSYDLPYFFYIIAFNNKTSSKYSSKYQFTNDVIELPAGTDGTGGKNASYVLFGDFPQSEAAPNITFNSYQTNGYYVGSDGNCYAYLNSKYYKVEPIKWRVLTDSYKYNNTDTGKLLLAENILTGNVSYGPDSGKIRHTNSNTTMYQNNYEYSIIRAYLNGLSFYENDGHSPLSGMAFYDKAFSYKAKSYIQKTNVDNGGESTTDAKKNISRANGKTGNGKTSTGKPDYTCSTTQDNIFLLSQKEVTSNAYGFADYNVSGLDTEKKDKTGRIHMTTDYARAKNVLQSSDNGFGGRWWLRSPYYDNDNTAYAVNYDGNSRSTGDVSTMDIGIVPALVVKY